MSVTRVMLMLPLLLLLGGCETSSFWDSANNASDRFQDMLGDFNPFGTAKKPLPGERRAVFPEGVPGVQQGVPPDLVRGSQQPGEPPPQAAAPAPAPAPKAKSAKATKSAKSKAKQAPDEDEPDPPDDGVWPPPASGPRR